ncbi:hypothetical protein GOP47_0029040 [Adiantum capillus-veneris]|nr:hypothetical protein GOP47_0029040 [Adiantum capillus-veneris]
MPHGSIEKLSEMIGSFHFGGRPFLGNHSETLILNLTLDMIWSGRDELPVPSLASPSSTSLTLRASPTLSPSTAFTLQPDTPKCSCFDSPSSSRIAEQSEAGTSERETKKQKTTQFKAKQKTATVSTDLKKAQSGVDPVNGISAGKAFELPSTIPKTTGDIGKEQAQVSTSVKHPVLDRLQQIQKKSMVGNLVIKTFEKLLVPYQTPLLVYETDQNGHDTITDGCVSTI